MDPLTLLTRWGIPLVFGSVLLEHGGLPVPAAPILVAAGALAGDGAMRPELVLLAGLFACLLADHAWFLAGRAYGRRLLATVCRLSLSPDSCVRKTDDLVARHGAPLLLVAKFIPGVSAVAVPTIAAMGLSYRRFLLFDALGCLMWSGAYVAGGMVFSRQLNPVLEAMGTVGAWSLGAIATLFGLYIAFKFVHRQRLRQLYRLVRITPLEMAGLLEADPDIIVLDARSELARRADPRSLPRSITVEGDDFLEVLPKDARDKTIITFCTCPNEASAALLAARLIKAGYSRVRVLSGGTDALQAFESVAVQYVAR
jgi:membrane protein DedA with SNARE-associated domain/rhodanese-related sulfurtransferase